MFQYERKDVKNEKIFTPFFTAPYFDLSGFWNKRNK